MSEIDIHDQRWGGYPPWFLRHSEFEGQGDFVEFFALTATRITQVVTYDEISFKNSLPSDDYKYLCAKLHSKTYQIFPIMEDVLKEGIGKKLGRFFHPLMLKRRAETKLESSENYLNILEPNTDPLARVDLIHQFKNQHLPLFERAGIRDTLCVLEDFLRLVKEIDTSGNCFPSIRKDLRSYLALTQVMLDIQDDPVLITPMDEPLFQKEIFGKLMPRLKSAFPHQAETLVGAYHRLLNEENTNKIFGDAFKSLEEIAQGVSSNPSLLLNDEKQLTKAFPSLHGVTKKLIKFLAEHRGDEGGHGGKGPPRDQMRFLLLLVCNVALLLLETRDAT